MSASEAASLRDAADRAVGAGDLGKARDLLRDAAESAGNDAALWLRLAAISRAQRDISDALDATHRALAIAPLDFTALLLRASLLDQLNRTEAGEAWAHALAQRPDGDVPENLAKVIAQAESRVEEWTGRRDDRMKSAMSSAEAKADEDELRRIVRFRSNALRRTRHYHSEPTHFHFPELPEIEFHPRSAFPWLGALEAATEILTAEMYAVMNAERAELVPYVQYPEHMPLDQWRTLNNNTDWTAIHLFQNGRTIEANARHCPATLELLSRCGQPKIAGASPNAMFSLLGPGIAIPPHVGFNNARLVCHLPLIVPEGCWFRVGAQTRYWRRGEAFVFDDTIEHEAMNPSAELRVVFIFDVWNPNLSLVEREAVKALIESEGVPSPTGL